MYFIASGGAVYWMNQLSLQTHLIPDSRLSVFSDNSALYGNNLASGGTGLFLPNDYLSYFNVTSGDLIFFTVSLVDYYGQVVTSDSSTVVSALPVSSWSGSTVQILVNGSVSFRELKYLIPPASFGNISFSCSGNYDSGTFSTINYKLTTRACTPGEYVESGVCKFCSVGTFTNTSMASACSSCPSV